MVISMFEYRVKNPSSSVAQSVRKLKAALAKKPSLEAVRAREEWYTRLNFNINYHKEHGRLPNNTDMDKVRGKGEYYTQHRGRPY